MNNLTSLSVAHSHALSTANLFALLEPNKGNLKYLDISGFPQLSRPDFVTLASSGYLSALVGLIMVASEVNDHDAEILAANLPCLTMLDITQSYVTGVGVKALTNKPGNKLERLKLNHCEHVGIDAVEYARARGIQVSFRFPGHNDGKAKRLRS